ncbi:uncharacterized protein si:dkey-171c9.3 [Mugil cephalus]|uniref:uncharacterized protein si:dkey-171c9.3 n=1 Tax=Mugil cephalus TaxID=48193 RepID=UPI001FB5A155|nr:uncharacterized protein si:dkey-171c9.3 [Mugil cephalus]
MQAVTADSRMPDPIPENLGTAEGLKRSPLKVEVLEEFAHNMADNIIHSLISQMDMLELEGSTSNQDQEMLAEELASAVIEIALREVCGGQNADDHFEGSFAGKSVKEKYSLGTQVDPVKECQTSRDAQFFHPPLSQSGLPLVGSLDYPDAPPTTPLIPELERSRHSFARKLKGGLAQVFLPSPPPPTPKDKEDNLDEAASDPQMELMEHLMHSLSTDGLARDKFDGGPHHRASTEAFAEALSCDIIDWVLNNKISEQIADHRDLHLLAQELAGTIITSSLDKAKTLV